MNPLVILEARAQARALLFAACEYEDLGEAITPLLVYAHESGVVDLIGADDTMMMIRKAFASVADEAFTG